MEQNVSCGVHMNTLTMLKQEIEMFRGILLWLLGIPIPIIILLYIFYR